MDVTIPLFRISQPTENLFKTQVARLLKECKVLHGLKYKEQSGVLYQRKKLCKLMIDALYQAYCSQLPNTGVSEIAFQFQQMRSAYDKANNRSTHSNCFGKQTFCRS